MLVQSDVFVKELKESPPFGPAPSLIFGLLVCQTHPSARHRRALFFYKIKLVSMFYLKLVYGFLSSLLLGQAARVQLAGVQLRPCTSYIL